MRAQGWRARGNLRILTVIAVVAQARRRQDIERMDLTGVSLGAERFVIRWCGVHDLRFPGGPSFGRRQRIFAYAVIALAQWIFLQKALEFLVQIGGRELQQSDRLL